MFEAQNVSVFYGRHRAVEGVSISVERGEIVAMLGANGAGKSTFLRAIGGLTPARPGCDIRMDDNDISHLPPHEIVEAGIALVPEERGIFADLTAEENLYLGANPLRAKAFEAENLDKVFHLFHRLAERRNQIVSTMSGGERQMVAIGRALMSQPAILMLDEPSLGLSPILTSELFRTLSEIKDTGVGIFLVEQNAKQSLAIADRAYLLDNGHIAGADTAQALAKDEQVIKSYLGGAEKVVNAPAPSSAQEVPTPVLGINAGNRGEARTDIEQVLPFSISELVEGATFAQSEHVKGSRPNGDAPAAPFAPAPAPREPVKTIELDDLQKMLAGMEEAAARALGRPKRQGE